MARLVTWAKLAGGVALTTLTHGLPLLILAVAAAGLAVLVWILSDDRRAERLNLLLRGHKLPRPAGIASDPDPASPGAPAQTVERTAGSPESHPQTIGYAANLRRTGLAEWAEWAERLEEVPQEGSAAEDQPRATRHLEPGP